VKREPGADAPGPARAGGRRRFVVDVAPLRRSRQFRLLFWGQAVSIVGRQFTVVAASFEVYQLTKSTLMVGLLSLAQLGPLLLFSLVGGSLADAMDRRRLLLVVQVFMAATSAGLAVNATLPTPTVWAIFVCTSASAALSAVDSPARTAIVPVVVAPELFPAASALQQIAMQGSQAVGPLLAGVVIAQLDIAAAYWIDVASFGVAILFLLGMHAMAPAGGGTRVGLRSVAEGLRFLRARRALQGTFVIDLNAMIFGMPRALFPEMAVRVFRGGGQVYGALSGAPGVGAVLGALTSGWVGHVRRQGRAVLYAVAVWGAAIAVFGTTRWLPLALVMLAAAGAADVVSAVFRNTILQLSVPDRLRGRLSAVHIAVVTGGPRLGDVEAGVVAAVSNTQVSAVSGGLACMVGTAVIARFMPQLAGWTPDMAQPEADGAAAAAPPRDDPAATPP
jgi:MFS family permease